MASAAVVALALGALTAGGSLLTRDGLLQVAGAGSSRRAAPPGPGHASGPPDRVAEGVPGIPAVVALRSLLAAAFSMVGTFLPLMLTAVHGLRPSLAGISLSVTGLSWAAGSRVHGLNAVQASVPPVARLRIGFALIGAGLSGPPCWPSGSSPCGPAWPCGAWPGSAWAWLRRPCPRSCSR